MKWSITYYYNIKFMKKNQLPLSITKWPPKFFSESSKKNCIHLDSKGTILGLTAFKLVPEQQCECPCKKKDWNHCNFLFTYYRQLSMIDFKKFIENYEDFANKLSSLTFVKIDEIVLLVYEKPDNMCSERTVLKKWFKKNGIELEEWRSKDESL